MYGYDSGKETACQCRRHGFDSWVGKIPWRGKWQPTPVFLAGKSHGQKSLAGYSPWGHKESNATEWLDNSNNKGHVIWGQRYFTSSFPVWMIFVCLFLSFFFCLIALARIPPLCWTAVGGQVFSSCSCLRGKHSVFSAEYDVLYHTEDVSSLPILMSVLS